MTWYSATIDEVKKIIRTDLERCDAEQLATFRKFAVEPYLAPLERYGRDEEVVVVARNGNVAMYWEDVEEGFNLSELDDTGRILHHYCGQEDLRGALNEWISGRTR